MISDNYHVNRLLLLVASIDVVPSKNQALCEY